MFNQEEDSLDYETKLEEEEIEELSTWNEMSYRKYNKTMQERLRDGE